MRAIGERKPFSRKTGSNMSPGPPGEPIIIQSASERSPIDRALACGDDLLVTITISVVTSGSTMSERHWSAGGRGPITMSVWLSRSAKAGERLRVHRRHTRFLRTKSRLSDRRRLGLLHRHRQPHRKGREVVTQILRK